MIFSWFVLLASGLCDIICANTHAGSKSKTLQVTLRIRKPSRHNQMNVIHIHKCEVGHDQAVASLLRLTLGWVADVTAEAMVKGVGFLRNVESYNIVFGSVSEGQWRIMETAVRAELKVFFDHQV
jgi:hypothetical protein